MKSAGIREARQNLSALIEEVRKGHEITITDRGRAVARLVPPLPDEAKPFRGRSAFRRKMPKLKVPLSRAVIDEREERI
jgi:prevent-host-death family protein